MGGHPLQQLGDRRQRFVVLPPPVDAEEGVLNLYPFSRWHRRHLPTLWYRANGDRLELLQQPKSLDLSDPLAAFAAWYAAGGFLTVPKGNPIVIFGVTLPTLITLVLVALLPLLLVIPAPPIEQQHHPPPAPPTQPTLLRIPKNLPNAPSA